MIEQYRKIIRPHIPENKRDIWDRNISLMIEFCPSEMRITLRKGIDGKELGRLSKLLHLISERCTMENFASCYRE